MAQIIGAGIFVISGVGVKIAGPGIILSFLVAGLAYFRWMERTFADVV